MDDVLLATGDATVSSYTVRFDSLDIDLKLWDETTRRVRATGVSYLTDVGSWECDGIVRLPELDSEDGEGFGIVSTEGEATLKFRAKAIDLGGSL
jgi:hypothetical protein